MSKKSNIEELFKDSMDDFRVDPPKETSKKILLALFWSNIIHHYKGAIIVSVAAALAGVGALFYFNQSTENTSSAKVENLNASNAVASMPHLLLAITLQLLANSIMHKKLVLKRALTTVNK